MAVYRVMNLKPHPHVIYQDQMNFHHLFYWIIIGHCHTGSSRPGDFPGTYFRLLKAVLN